MLTQIQYPAIEPLSLADAKNYLRVEVSEDDDLINDLIVAARIECEHRTGRSFILQKWRLTLDSLGGSALSFGGFTPLQLPRSPLISIESINFVGQNGQNTVLDLDNLVIAPGTPGLIAPRYGNFWPFTLPQISSVAIEYTAGFGPTPSDIPKNIIQAIRILTAHYYENRSENAEIPAAVNSLLSISWWPSYA